MNIPVLAYVVMVSSLFPLLIGLYKWNYLKKPLRYFVLFLFVTVVQIATEYIMGRNKLPTQYLTDIYISFEVTFMLLFYRQFVKSHITRAIFIFLIVSIFVIWVVSSLFIVGNPQFNSFLSFSARFILITSSMMIIHILSTSGETAYAPIHRHYVFWISSGVLTYCTGSFIVVSLGNEIMKLGLDYFFAMWYINWIFFICSNILFSIAFYDPNR